jgi:hypothetical protein
MYVSQQKKAANTLMMILIISGLCILCIFIKSIGKRMENDKTWPIKQKCLGPCLIKKKIDKCVRECMARLKEAP